MNNSNIKIYLGISFALIIIFILILVIPFTKQPVTNNQQSTINLPTPTSVETNPSSVTIKPTPITVPAHFTGAIEETMPKQVIDLAAQKKDLLSKVPLSLTTFTIDFDYSTDKFVVALKDPKDQAQKEFESWRAANYPGLDTNQFLLK
jgi:hypothetical protein